MKIPLIILAVVLISLIVWYSNSKSFNPPDIKNLPEISFPTPERQSSTADSELTTVIAENLDTPWGISFLPDKSMLVTERKGTVRLIDSNGKLQDESVAQISSVREIGEGGLLGITIHPDFAENNFIYLYYTYSESGSNTLNRVVRMAFKDNKLTDEKIIVDQIPGASNHDGGRIKFGPDKLLYIGTGDAQEPSLAQNTSSLAGKILRATDEGNPAPGNSFNNRVYSYGHRNVQGFTWDQNGTMFATEHGRSGVQSGLDEINHIQPGKNYGWMEIQGNETRAGMETPIRNSGSTTWAPSGMAFLNGSLFFGGLRGQTLYEAVLEVDQVKEVKEHFRSQFGRIRDVVVGPDNMLYITTSNRDGRGNPQDTDDRIIKINPNKI